MTDTVVETFEPDLQRHYVVQYQDLTQGWTDVQPGVIYPDPLTTTYPTDGLFDDQGLSVHTFEVRARHSSVEDARTSALTVRDYWGTPTRIIQRG